MPHFFIPRVFILRKLIPAQRLCALLLPALIALIGTNAVAQPSPGKESVQSAVATVTLDAELVRTGLYLITGGGANSLLRLSANGLILVDGKGPGSYRALMSQVRKLSKFGDMPLRVLIVTDGQGNRTGNAAQFLSAKVPILAQQNVASRLPPADAKVAPIVTFDRDYEFSLGGVDVRLFHFGKAHTDGDTVVYFPNLKVVAVGDLYTTATPVADFAAGGSLKNWGPVLDRVLKLDFDLVVPSSGPVATRAEFEAFARKMNALDERALALVKRGVAKEQLIGELNAADPDWRLSLTSDELDRFYAELSIAK